MRCQEQISKQLAQKLGCWLSERDECESPMQISRKQRRKFCTRRRRVYQRACICRCRVCNVGPIVQASLANGLPTSILLLLTVGICLYSAYWHYTVCNISCASVSSYLASLSSWAKSWLNYGYKGLYIVWEIVSLCCGSQRWLTGLNHASIQKRGPNHKLIVLYDWSKK